MPFGSIVRSIANLRLWRGAKPNELVAGRVDVSLGAAVAGLTGVKSCQMGMEHMYKTAYTNVVINQESTVTINAVTVNKSIVLVTMSGAGNIHSSNFTLIDAEGWLSDATSLMLRCSQRAGASLTTNRYVRGDIYWTVVEYY